MNYKTESDSDRRMLNKLDRIIFLLRRLLFTKKATSLNLILTLEPLIPKEPPTMPFNLSAKFDLNQVRMKLSPNGPLDDTPTWTNDGVGDLKVEADGMSAILTSSDPGDSKITITATVDDPTTTEFETISDSGSIAWSHSKASNLGLSATIDNLPV